jgi:transcriptional regulator with XRE-family HTH domain
MTDTLTYADPTSRAVAALAAARGWDLRTLADNAGMPRGTLSQKMNLLQGRRLLNEDIALLADTLGVEPFDLARGVIAVRVSEDGPLRPLTHRYAPA